MSISAYPPRRPQQWSPEERYRFLSTILESFAGTLDLEEALRRIANITLEQFAADREIAKATAILDPIPEPAAIYDTNGRLERMNAAAMREGASFFKQMHDTSVIERALQGESSGAEYVVHDQRTNEDRIVNVKAAP